MRRTPQRRWPAAAAVILAAAAPTLAARPAAREPRSAAAPARTVEAATRPGRPFVPFPTRTLDDFPGLPSDGPADRFGGAAAGRGRGSGFFRAERIDGRWWLVDPDGGRFVCRGVNSIAPTPTPAGRAALGRLFADQAGWAEATVAMLRAAGFNCAGAWSDHDALSQVATRLPETRLWNFMAAYGKKRGGTVMQAGHIGYPGDCPFVFDPGFADFCAEHARQLVADRDSPWVLGHHSDNEMPWKRSLLESYLGLPEGDHGRAAAREWLAQRHGTAASAASVTEDDRRDFLEFAIDRYLSIVAAAVRAADPNHLFLGPRLHEPCFDLPEVFRACGRHCDVVSVNYYRAWSPDAAQVAMWARESGRPFLVTEHYAKGADSGMGNSSGAGWLVKTQQDRGRFYQNFAIGLLECGDCVGWFWHRYADNDPLDRKADPSNRDSNKGMVSATYEPWAPLVAEMTGLNRRVHGLVIALDAGRGPAVVATATEAGDDDPPGDQPDDRPDDKPAARKDRKEREVIFPDDVRVERDVAYLPPERRQKADLYFPQEAPADGRLPAVIVIHGGGFNDGDKDRRREVNIASHLARRGYVAMSIDYQLWNKGVKRPTWPQSLHDAKSAVRWLRRHAARLGIDPDRIGAIGCSAGGNLVSMLAVTGPKDGLEPSDGDTAISTAVRCAVDLYGAVDLLEYHDMKMFLKTRAEDPDVYRRASPTSYCDAGDAPILIIHGTGDRTVDVSQSRTLARALEAGGVPHRLIVIPDAPHTFDLDYEAFDVKTPVLEFLAEHLRPGKNPPAKAPLNRAR